MTSLPCITEPKVFGLYWSMPLAERCRPRSMIGRWYFASGLTPTGYCGVSNGSTAAVGLPPLST